MREVIIVGSGPAGVSSAVYLKRFNHDVAVISSGVGTLSLAHQVYDYYGYFNVSGKDIFQKGLEQLNHLNIPMIEENVLSIEYYGHFVITTNKSTYEAKKVILATGKARNKLQIKNAKDYESKGLSYCATCDGFFYRNKKIGIIGSGEFMLHELSFLKNISNDITIFSEGNDLVVEGCNVVKDKIISLYGEEYLEGVNTTEASYPLDGLFVAIGEGSTFDLIKHMGISVDKNNNILVDSNYQTNIKNLYAIGDAIGGVLQIAKASYDGMMVSYAIHNEGRQLNGKD